MRQFCLLFLLLFTGIRLRAQQLTITYRTPADSSSKYYLTVPATGNANGLLVLLPGYGELPEYVQGETDLPNEAARRGLTTVILTLQQGWQTFYVDTTSQQTIGRMIRDIQVRYGLTNKKLYIGGFSLGGSGAVRYAERAVTDKTLPQPAAIFAIDPPLDFARLYQSSQRQRKYGKVDVAVSEANFLIERMNKEFDGSPTTNFSRYVALSPYCYQDTTNHNSAALLRMPIRLISELDIQWQLTNRNRDLYDANTTDCVGLINYLRTMGNTNAEFIATVNKGYRRQQKIRHPHAWSIADPTETITWLLNY